MSIQGKLNRFKKHLSTGTPPPTEKNAPHKQSVNDKVPFLEKWQNIQAQPFFFEGEYVIVRELRYPIEHKHGNARFSQLKEVVERWNEQHLAHPLSAHSKTHSDLLFFDTETTGLGGGTGNTIFMLGYSRVLGDEVLVKQFFLPSPASEIAFYQGFLSDVKSLKNLVTYNGKAFDWPQVKTRHTLIRDSVPKLPSFGHYDLLHASRRLWKDKLPSCRLSIVEEEIIGFQRQGDTAGYLAPMLYFQYIQEKDPEIMEGVFQHNQWDVLSLMTLYIHISQMLLMEQPSATSAKEMYEIGRWYEHVQEREQAQLFYEKVAREPSSQQNLAKNALAFLYKKQKEYHKAKSIWEQMLTESPANLTDIHTELAKIYEHRQVDYDRALHHAQKAHDHKRIQRLQSKVNLLI